MVVIVGLGNPGPAYRDTRHNAGAMVVRKLADELGVRFRREGPVMVGQGELEEKPVILGVPQTFMNASGGAVSAVLARWPVPLADLLVLCDDVALPFGTLRVRSRGSDGGHRGLRSIIESIGGEGFPRLRIGVGQAGMPEALEGFVLARFGPEEGRQLPVVIAAASAACGMWVRHGIAETMNRYNRKVCG